MCIRDRVVTFPTAVPGAAGEDHIKIDTSTIGAADTITFDDNYGYSLNDDMIVFGDESEKPSDPA